MTKMEDEILERMQQAATKFCTAVKEMKQTVDSLRVQCTEFCVTAEEMKRAADSARVQYLESQERHEF